MHYIKLVSISSTGTIAWAAAALSTGTPVTVVTIGGLLMNALVLGLGSMENLDPESA